jgi:mono/diheme cytochrome c family protein
VDAGAFLALNVPVEFCVMSSRLWLWGCGSVLGGSILAAAAMASLAQPAPEKTAPVKPAPAKPVPEHGGHGTPEGWKFSWPAGNPASGREVFVKLECYTCHEVKGETFPAPDPGRVGPELASMASLHPAEYFAEAIINPNAVVEEDRGYRAPDGKSKMPSYNDLVTVQEIIDLVAYLKYLKPDGRTPAHGGAIAPSDGHGGLGGSRMPGGQMPRH